MHRVAEQRLRLARQRAHDVDRRGEVLVLLGAQPPEAVAHVHAAPAHVGGDVRAAAVQRRAEVQRPPNPAAISAGDELVRRGHAIARPTVTARHDTRRAVVGGEVDERDHRRDLDLGMRVGQVHPHQLVAVDHLLLRARTAVQHVRDVELVRRAARQQDRVAHRPVHRVREDLGREHARLARDAGDVARLRAEEPLDHVVDEHAILARAARPRGTGRARR